MAIAKKSPITKIIPNKLVVPKYNFKSDPHNRTAPPIQKHTGFKLANMMLPAKYSLVDHMPPVYDQAQTSSCTANGLVALVEHLELTSGEFLVNGAKYIPLSRLFVYYNERNIEGDPNQDNGAVAADGVHSLMQFGAATESAWPFSEQALLACPAPNVYQDAVNRKITAAANVPQDIDSIKRTLFSGYPIGVGIQLYQSFESDTVAANGIVSMPVSNENCLGGHYVVIVGYDTTGAIPMAQMRNSWGASWGQQGYFWIPFDYLLNPNLAEDFWVVNK